MVPPHADMVPPHADMVPPHLDSELIEDGLSQRRFQGLSGWLVSALMHMAFLLGLMLITLPIGREFTASLLVKMSDDIESESPTFELIAKEEEPAPDVSDVPLVDVQPLDVVLQADVADIVDPRAKFDTGTQIGSPLETQVGSALKKADVTFFGTSASGRDFIFILDCSGSMHARDGERFERARDELLNSISMLREEQRFYVFLFNWSTFPMFGPVENPGKLIEATGENIAKLRAWLYTVYPESGTDPRYALAESLIMQPDAIFLLSDGQFNTPNSPNPALGWNNSRTSVFDVVGHKDAPRVQINTVAFEDAVAAQGMQRLAKESDGQFRFVPAPGRENQAFGNEEADAIAVGPEYEPATQAERLQMAKDILLIRRAEKLVTRDRHEQARELVKELDPDKLPREARARLIALRK